MNLAVIGTGYVGLVSAACFAELGHTVYGVDIDQAKIDKLKRGESPIYEPGLEEIIKRGLENGRLSFTTDSTEVLPKVQILFCAVATPSGEGHKADLRAVFSVAETVAKHIDHDLVFVNKSTVPVGTGKQCEEKIKEILKNRNMTIKIPVVSNPEFLREGMAVSDTLMPDRIVIGINGNTWAQEMMEELYRPITRVGKPILFMSRESAEIVKYASNSFLATKISFINMMSELAEKTGADIRDVAQGMGMDDRIGPRFLHAGIGYGGSCFPKDVKALLATAKEYDLDFSIIQATDQVNHRQRHRFFQKIIDTVPTGSTVAIWGLAFKPKTDDMRDAPSLDLIPMLLEKGYTVKAYDPAAMENAKKVLPEQIQFAGSPLEAAKEADVLVILTEWDEFRGVNLAETQKLMKGDLLFDGRNIYDPKEAQEAGFVYMGIGIS
ncbi:MAG: UDP-glucose 6-dehydrogenase [Candidatus Peribacteria bacterium]|nr:UDP-glucose 6-dehydrogenase [Candidatus Peribacteria bacterium]